ncbi:MAG: hypothetical protein Q7O66_04495, partial [Dehalococcoidia bacterium]|nr:hypothetical protein [Dehalococcoidia bacterium]
LLPLGISAIIREGWTKAQKSLAAFGLCLVGAAGTAYFTGNLNFDNDTIARIALIVFMAAITSYTGLWKPSGTSDAIDKATG